MVVERRVTTRQLPTRERAGVARALEDALAEAAAKGLYGDVTVRAKTERGIIQVAELEFAERKQPRA